MASLSYIQVNPRRCSPSATPVWTCQGGTSELRERLWLAQRKRSDWVNLRLRAWWLHHPVDQMTEGHVSASDAGECNKSRIQSGSGPSQAPYTGRPRDCLIWLWLIRYQWRGSQLRTKTRWWRCSRRGRNAQCVNWVPLAATFWNFSDPSGPPCSFFRPLSATLLQFCYFKSRENLKVQKFHSFWRLKIFMVTNLLILASCFEIFLFSPRSHDGRGNEMMYLTCGTNIFQMDLSNCRKPRTINGRNPAPLEMYKAL